MPRKICTRTSLRVATFHARSYGFRTGRSAHDAQKYIFDNLNSISNGIEKRVIELDIEKCNDLINHSAIMDELMVPKGLKLGIFRCLKAGVNPEFPEQGTPQGGVVSPLLANIALNGIERHYCPFRTGQSLWLLALVVNTFVRSADSATGLLV